jgi:uncharacterized membrane protein
MLALAHWLSETSASLALREFSWTISILQAVHILAIAAVMSSLFMIDLRVLRATATQKQSLADVAHRFEAWIWSGLVVLAATGTTLVVAEPKRTLLNGSFQIKIVLLVLAVATTFALRTSLRRDAEFASVSGKATGMAKALAVGVSLLWCAVAAAGRFIAYTQPS